MATAVVTVASGGLPVIDVTATFPKLGMPVTEAIAIGAKKYGIPVTKVAAGGVPVTFVVSDLVPAGGGAALSTLNSADKSANLTLSNGNMTATATSGSNAGVRSTTGKTSGKLYVEFYTGATWSSSGGNAGFGIMSAAPALNNFGAGNATGGCLTLAYGGGNIYFNGGGVGGGIGVFGPNQQFGVAVDLGASKLWFRSGAVTGWTGNGANADPATGVSGINIAAVFPGSPAFVAVSFDGSGSIVTINTGATAFTNGGPPSGFSAWG